MIDDEHINGEIARALTLSGLSFHTQRAENDGRAVRFFNMAFEGPDGSPPFFLAAYVTTPFFVVSCALRLLSDQTLDHMSEVVHLHVPMVRLVKESPESQQTPGLFWVEATSVVPPGPWATDAHVLVAMPVTVVQAATRTLLTKFPSEVEVTKIMRMPVMDVSVAALSRSSMPAAEKVAG